MLGNILTAAGIQRFLTATPEDQITITEFAVGDGGGPNNTVDPTMTELRREVWRGEASAPIRDPLNPNVLTFETMIPADVGGFTIRELGLYDEQGQLVAVGITSETEKPTLSQAIGFTLTVRLHIALANADDVSLVVQEAGSIDHQGLTNRKALDCHPASAISINEVSDHPELKTVQDIANKIWATQQTHKGKIEHLESELESGLGEVTIDGDVLVYPGSTNTYKITNYDSFSQYQVTASRETVSRSNDTITLTVAAGAENGELKITVKRDGRDSVFGLAVGEAGIQTPKITQPANGATTTSLAAIIKASPFASFPQGIDAHVSTDWQVASDAGFATIVFSSLANTANKTEITIPSDTLAIDTMYYVRARYNGATHQSAYSSVTSFKTPNNYIVTPSIILPVNGAIDVSESPVLESSAFQSVPADFDIHQGSSWMIKKRSTNETVWSMMRSTENKRSIIVPAGVLLESTEYAALVKHEGASLGESGWSVESFFTTGDQFMPSVPGTPFGGGYFAGLYQLDGKIYAIVVAPKMAEKTLAWKISNSNDSTGFTIDDGLKNTAGLTADSKKEHLAAWHCVDGRWGGFNDWYLGSTNEMDVVYFGLKPTTRPNSTSWGKNQNSVPPRSSNNTANTPSQTTSNLFKSGGSEAFDDARYWTSVQSLTSQARTFSFESGTQGYWEKTSLILVRPIRRVLIN